MAPGSCSRRSSTAARPARSAPATRALGAGSGSGRRARSPSGWRTPPASGWRCRFFLTTSAWPRGRLPGGVRYLDRLLSLADRAIPADAGALPGRVGPAEQRAAARPCRARARVRRTARRGRRRARPGPRGLGRRGRRAVRRRARVPGRARRHPAPLSRRRGVCRSARRGTGGARRSPSPRPGPRHDDCRPASRRPGARDRWPAAARVRVQRPAARRRGGAQADRARRAGETPAAPSPRCCSTMCSPPSTANANDAWPGGCWRPPAARCSSRRRGATSCRRISRSRCGGWTPERSFREGSAPPSGHAGRRPGELPQAIGVLQAAAAGGHRRAVGGAGRAADRGRHGPRVGHARRSAPGSRRDGGVGQRTESDDAPDSRPPQRGSHRTREGNPLGAGSAPAPSDGAHGQERARRHRRHAAVQSRIDPGPQGSGGRPQASRDVHRVHQRERPAPPGLRGGGQLDRRGAGRPLRRDQRHHPRRQLDHGAGQRPRDPGGRAPDREDPRRRARADRAARRRQVRQEQLQGVRRPARRRRVGGERPVRAARGGGGPRRQASPHGVRARQDGQEARGPRRQSPRHRHDHPLQARSRDLHGARVPLLDPGGPAPAARVPEQGHLDHDQGRARGPEEGGGLLRQGRPGRVRPVAQPEQEAAPSQADLLQRHQGRRRGRPGLAVRGWVQREHLHLREQHQHPRRRHSPDRLQVGAHPHDQRSRQEARLPQEGGLHPLRRGHPRGAHVRAACEGAGTPVRGADQDQAGQLGGRGNRQDGRERAARQLSRRAPAGCAEHHREGGQRGPGPRGGPEGARPGTEEVRTRERRAAGQAGGLLATTIRRCARSTWSRATPPAAARNRHGSANSRPSCRSAARS